MADIKIARGTFSTPGSTGNFNVTGLGFDDCEFVFCHATQVTSNDSNTAAVGHMMGITDMTNDRCCVHASSDTVHNTLRRAVNDAFIRGVNGDSDTPDYIATMVGAITDGFQLNFSSVAGGSGFIVHYFAVGGADANAVVGTQSFGAGSVTGVGFTSDLVGCISVCSANENVDEQYSFMSLGFAHDNGSSIDQWVAAIYGSDGTGSGTGDNKHSLLVDGTFIRQLGAEYTAWNAVCTVIGTDGFTWTGGNADDVYYFCLDLAGTGVYVDTVAKETGAAPDTQTLPDFGFTPQAMLLASCSELSGAAETADNNCRFSVGSYDGSAQGCSITTELNSSNTEQWQRSMNDRAIALSDDLGTAVDAEGTVQSFTDSTPDIIWDPNNSEADLIGFVGFTSQGTPFVEQGTAGAVSVTGFVAALDLGFVAAGTLGNAAVTGFVSALSLGLDVSGTLGNVAVTGFAGEVDVSKPFPYHIIKQKRRDMRAMLTL